MLVGQGEPGKTWSEVFVAMKSALLSALLATAMLTTTAIAKDYWLDETPAERDARMQWWVEARFGMFIHWGLYAVPAGEWNGKHEPRRVDPDQRQDPDGRPTTSSSTSSTR